jgi:arsenate reductase
MLWTAANSRRSIGPSLERTAAVQGGRHMVLVSTNAPKRIVFVCVENSNRSQMAEAFARLHAQGRVEAYSAGSRPSGRINPRAIEAMREVGYDLQQHHSKSLDDLADITFDVAVTMGCGDQCPLLQAQRREDWNIPDPKEMPSDQFRQIRDSIEQKVKELLETL